MKYYHEEKTEDDDSYYPEENVVDYEHDRDEYIGHIIAKYKHEAGEPIGFIKKKEINRYIVSTQVSKSKHILALDIDSEDDFAAAVVSLSRRELGFYKINSSENSENCWLIVDAIGEWNKIKHLLDLIPGSDKNFVKCCKEREKITLRAINKGNYFPEVTSSPPETKNQEVSEWVESYESLMKELELAWKDIQMSKALREGKISEYLSDPQSLK